MSWQDLIQKPEETITAPWTGGWILSLGDRVWQLKRTRPVEHGWYQFQTDGRIATNPQATIPKPELLQQIVTGYLVGDRLIIDGTRADEALRHSARVFLLETGLARFARIRAGRTWEEGPLVFMNQEMPIGPEDAVAQAYEDRLTSVNHVPNVAPGLDAAFRMATFQRAEVERRRLELERLRLEEEARKVREERRQELVKLLGDGAGRREMAIHDFTTAARAALAVGDAEYLDHRTLARGEFAVKYRLDGARYECVCDTHMRIIDAGICLTDGDTGEKGDTYFTLESIPGIVRQARREGVLVVYRHV